MVIVPCTCIKSFIIFWYQVTGVCIPKKYLSRVFLSATPLEVLIFSTPNRYPFSYSYELLLSFNYTIAAQTTPYWYSFQLFLSATPSYSHQLLLSAARYYHLLHQLLLTVLATLVNQSFQGLVSGTALSLSHTLISHSHQPFLSGTFISHLYQLYSHIPIRCSYQNSFLTNHYQFQYHILIYSHSQMFFKIGVLKAFAILTRKHLQTSPEKTMALDPN